MHRCSGKLRRKKGGCRQGEVRGQGGCGEKKKEVFAPMVKKEMVKGVEKEVAVVEVSVDVAPPKKHVRVEGGISGEVERGKYVPAWDIPLNLVMGVQEFS